MNVIQTDQPPLFDLSIVLPVYNEEGNIASLDAELRSVLHSLNLATEIIYIDDRSTDGSLKVLEGILEATRDDVVRTRVARFRRNYGQTAAMTAGFQLAEGRVIMPMDADGQNNPADIPRLLAELDRGLDVVSGWRKDRKDKAISRKIPSRIANICIGLISGVRLHDYGCTLKAYRGSLLKELHLYGEMHRFIPLYLNHIGAKVGELPVDHRPRMAGVSKYGSRRIIKVLLDMVMIRFMTRYYTRPMHFFGQMGIIFAILLAITFFFMVVFKYGWLRLIGIDYQASFITTPLPALAATFMLGTVVSIFFGILSEIMIRVHYESRSAWPFSIESVMDSKRP